VVPILPEWQIVQSFVRVFYVINGTHRVQCSTGFCLGNLFEKQFDVCVFKKFSKQTLYFTNSFKYLD